jgi:hypothetical protein
MATKLNVVTIKNLESIKSEVSRIFTPTATDGWILVRYTEPTTLELQAVSSGPVEELVQHLDESQVQYALIRLPANHEGICKDVFLTWAGPKVCKIERGKKSEHNADVKSVLGPSHVDLTALTKQRFSSQTLAALADPAAGSHVLKPLESEEERVVFQATVDADVRAHHESSEKQKSLAAEKIAKKTTELKSTPTDDSEKLTVVTLVGAEAIRKAVAILLDRATPRGWLIVGYVGTTNNIELVAYGFGGIDEFLGHLKDDQMQYLLLRLPADPVTKDIFINWVGPKVSKIQQGKKSEHHGDLKSVLGPVHGDLTVLTKIGFNDQKIRELADPSSGTHILKPPE